MPCHQTLSALVDQDCALAPHGLAHQRHRISADIQRGRMELDEFHVAEHGTGTSGKRQPLSDRGERIGRMPIEAADAAGRDDDA